MDRRGRKRRNQPRPPQRKKFLSNIASSSEFSDSEDEPLAQAQRASINSERESSDVSSGSENSHRDDLSSHSSAAHSVNTDNVSENESLPPSAADIPHNIGDHDNLSSDETSHESDISMEAHGEGPEDEDNLDFDNQSERDSANDNESDEVFYDSSSEISVRSINAREDGSEESGSEGDSSIDLDDNNDPQGDRPLYPGSPLSLHESLMAILTLATVEHLSGILLVKILTLIELHCPLDNICKKTLYTFKKYFAKIASSVVKCHYYCSNCIFPVESETSVCPKCEKQDNSFFLEVPLLLQIQSLFQRRNFYENLQHRFDPNRKQNADNIYDIYDGDVYKEQMENGFLTNPNNVSFLAYSDGINVSRSSTFSVWPCFLVVNELPYKKRILPQNILLAGLWFGKMKPSPNIFLRPLKNSLDVLKTNGYRVKLFDGSEIIVKAKMLCFTCDLPAKCKFLSFKQFNGFFGCAHCLTPGERFRVGQRSSVHVYPYNGQDAAPRTHNQTRQSAEKALDNRRRNKRDYAEQGVKSLSLLFFMMPDIIKCLAIDIMHCVFLGVCKTLLTLWFSSEYSHMPWTLYGRFEEIDERLQRIKVPSYVQRFTRSLKDIAQWKASEFKLFLMYFSVPLFQGVMDDNYLHHHCKLVSGLYLLSQDSISPGQIGAASALLKSYVTDFGRLYDLRYLGMNFHQLTHLPGVVKNLGPLWVYCCFFLESLNGEIIQLFHGTQHIALQICSAVTIFKQLPILIDELPADSMCFKYCKSLYRATKAVKIADAVDAETFSVGTYKRPLGHFQSTRDLLRTINIFGGSFNLFFSLRKGGVLYSSKDYNRVSKRKESSFVKFTDVNIPNIGRIIRFVRWSDCTPNCETVCRNCDSLYFCVIEVYRRKIWFPHNFPDVRLSFLSQVESTGRILISPVASLQCLCFYYRVGGHEFLGCPINGVEVE